MDCSNFFPLEIIDINVENGPLLKEYYWKYLNIKGLNSLFLQANNTECLIATLNIPPMPINSQPLKIILRVCNVENVKVNWEFSRIKLCDCKMKRIATTINQFRNAYDCLHRTLLTIFPAEGSVKPGEITSIELFISYNVVGETILAYEFLVCSKYKIRLNFVFNIVEFDPLICVITKELFPTQITSVYQPIQAIWIYNPYNQDLAFEFDSKEKSIEILENFLVIPTQKIVPLLIRFSPNKLFEYDLLFTLKFANILNTFSIKGSTSTYYIPLPGPFSPKTDVLSICPFTMYQNHLTVKLSANEICTKMVVVHNQSNECVEFKWLNYEIKDLFSVEVNPSTSSCKPNHSISCLIKLTALQKSCIFHNIRLTCEIHRYNKVKNFLNIYQNSISDTDSLDNDLVRCVTTNTFISQIYLNVNIRIEGSANIEKPIPKEIDLQLAKKKIPLKFDRNILDKIFWNFVFHENFVSDLINRKSDETNYSDLKNKTNNLPLTSRRTTVALLTTLTTIAVNEISKRKESLSK